MGIGIGLVRPKPHLQPHPDTNYIHTQNYTYAILALYAFIALIDLLFPRSSAAVKINKARLTFFLNLAYTLAY